LARLRQRRTSTPNPRKNRSNIARSYSRLGFGTRWQVVDSAVSQSFGERQGTLSLRQIRKMSTDSQGFVLIRAVLHEPSKESRDYR
jgi:hypothetical protein